MKHIVILKVTNHKELGILILSICQAGSDSISYFKPYQQPLRKHPEEIREIVKNANPTSRKKSIKVDISDFLREYWNGTEFEFKGVKLKSTEEQTQMVYQRLMNKELGAVKRKHTIEENKKRKAEEVDQKLREKRLKAEELFQSERAFRIAEVWKVLDTKQAQQERQAVESQLEDEQRMLCD